MEYVYNPFTNNLDAIGSGTPGGKTPVVELTPQAHTAPGTSPVLADASGNINVNGTVVAAHSIPIQTDSLAANTINVEMQYASAVASTDATKVGLASFDSSKFSVDANGFVTTTGGGGGITTINGDTGSVTGSTIAFNGLPQAGSSVSFSGSGTTMSLNTTDASNNTLIGLGAGNATIGSGNNVGIGHNSCHSLTFGGANVCVGVNTLISGATAQFNTIVGTSSGNSLFNGGFNLLLGNSVGNNYSGAESSNILLMNTGINGESNVMRLGTSGSGSGQVNACYVAGINGKTVSNQQFVVIDSSTDQLGTVSSPALTSGFINLPSVSSSLTTATPKSIITHSFPAGTYIMSAQCDFDNGGGGFTTQTTINIGSSVAGLNGDYGNNIMDGTNVTASAHGAASVTCTIVVPSTTTYHVVVVATFAAGTLSVGGSLTWLKVA